MEVGRSPEETKGLISGLILLNHLPVYAVEGWKFLFNLGRREDGLIWPTGAAVSKDLSPPGYFDGVAHPGPRNGGLKRKLPRSCGMEETMRLVTCNHGQASTTRKMLLGGFQKTRTEGRIGNILPLFLAGAPFGWDGCYIIIVRSIFDLGIRQFGPAGDVSCILVVLLKDRRLLT